uniref:Uncharacterized protein n=1 Tax=Romanomermis culicivorax TaxID=13658 RepID=A0A915JKV5_ROMCU
MANCAYQTSLTDLSINWKAEILFSNQTGGCRAALFVIVAVGQYQLLMGEVKDYAPAWVDFTKNANLRGPWGGGCQERPRLDDADIIIDGMQRLSAQKPLRPWLVNWLRRPMVVAGQLLIAFGHLSSSWAMGLACSMARQTVSTASDDGRPSKRSLLTGVAQ